MSETEKIDMGLKFSQIIQTFNSVGIPLKESIELAKTFAPSADISEETMKALTDADDSEVTADIWEMLQANRGLKNE